MVRLWGRVEIQGPEQAASIARQRVRSWRPRPGVRWTFTPTMTIAQIAGILPAIVFPAATFLQLYRIIRNRSAAGVNVATWFLFGWANVAIYIYAGHYDEWQAISGMLLTAVLDFAIVGLALFAYRPRGGGLIPENRPSINPAAATPETLRALPTARSL